MLPQLDDGFVLFVGPFLGAIVTSFAGFAFSPVAGIVMIGAVPPQQLIPLLMLCSVLIQTAMAIHARRAPIADTSVAMLLGGVAGVPFALLLLRQLDMVAFQMGFGLFMALYALLLLTRSRRRYRRRCGPLVEAGIGVLGGFVGGLTAMPGAVPVLYADRCGLPKDAQRAMVQPFILFMQLFALGIMAMSDGIDYTTVALATSALPALAAGTMIGLLLFRRVPDTGFRRAVLVLLLVTGAGTAISQAHGLAARSTPPTSTWLGPGSP